MVIIEVENFTPELERDVAVQFFTVNGVAIGKSSSQLNHLLYNYVFYHSLQMDMTMLVFQRASRTL